MRSVVSLSLGYGTHTRGTGTYWVGEVVERLEWRGCKGGKVGETGGVLGNLYRLSEGGVPET